jgi:hypothetical protein
MELRKYLSTAPMLPSLPKTPAQAAKALSQIGRWCGRQPYYYSVAQHSVFVAQHVYRATHSKQLARAAMVHDLCETVIGDLPEPIKNCIEWYQELEEAVDRAVIGTTCLPIHDGNVVDADTAIKGRERNWINGSGAPVFVGPHEAKTMWMLAWEDYDGKLTW